MFHRRTGPNKRQWHYRNEISIERGIARDFDTRTMCFTPNSFKGDQAERSNKKEWVFDVLALWLLLCSRCRGVGFSHSPRDSIVPRNRGNVLTPRVITLASIESACPVIRDTSFYPRSGWISCCVPFRMNTCLYTSGERAIELLFRVLVAPVAFPFY